MQLLPIDEGQDLRRHNSMDMVYNYESSEDSEDIYRR